MKSKYIDWAILYGNEDTGEEIEITVKARSLVDASVKGTRRLHSYISRGIASEGDWWIRPMYPMPFNQYLREGSGN